MLLMFMLSIFMFFVFAFFELGVAALVLAGAALPLFELSDVVHPVQTTVAASKRTRAMVRLIEVPPVCISYTMLAELKQQLGVLKRNFINRARSHPSPDKVREVICFSIDLTVSRSPPAPRIWSPYRERLRQCRS